jgi:hypothetical protein
MDSRDLPPASGRRAVPETGQGTPQNLESVRSADDAQARRCLTQPLLACFARTRRCSGPSGRDLPNLAD